MKKLLIFLIALVMLCPAHAEMSMFLPIGPYTYDSKGSMCYNYEGEGAMYIDYLWGYIYLEYIEFSPEWITPEHLRTYYGAHNSWEIAEACMDIWYGEGNPFYADTADEGFDLQYFPACYLFTCTFADEFGGGVSPFAVFVDDNGILFVECVPYVSPAVAPEMRSLVLSRLFFNGESVISPKTAEAAYAARTVDTKPAVIEFGDDFTYDTTGCTSYTKAGDDYVTIIYGNHTAVIEYWAYNEIIYLPEVVDRAAAAEDTEAQLAKICYTKYIIPSDSNKDLKLEGMASDGEKGTLLYNSRDTDSDIYIAGAVCANKYGTLFIYIFNSYEEGRLEDLQQLHGEILENITCIIMD